MAETLFIELVNLCEKLTRTKSKLKLAELVAEFLKKLAPEEIAPATLILLGQIFPEEEGSRLEVSVATVEKVIKEISKEVDYSSLSAAVDFGEAIMTLLTRSGHSPGGDPLKILEAYKTLLEIAKIKGRGSREEKEKLLGRLLKQATVLEAKYLVKSIVGEMRHGVSEGILLDALSRLAGVKRERVVRAYMLSSDLGRLAEVVLTQGQGGLEGVSLKFFKPIRPMLAQSARDLEEVFQYHRGETALEYKLDGARVQIHKAKDRVAIFSRHLREVTASLPEVVQMVKDSLLAQEAILEGEVIAVGKDSRPLPFQHLMRRFRRILNIEEMKEEIPIRLYLFDLLYVDGETLIDFPYEKRWLRLEEIRGRIPLVPRIISIDLEEGRHFFEEAQKEGHEGLMAKQLQSPYTPGVRGKAWFKIKPALTLDLVIVAADYGYGRRHGWLSNYHLAAREEERGKYLVIGKTFKGLTDEEFREMTRRLKAIQISEKGWTVFVRPQIVVEVEFNEIQRSPHYRSGYALRFARISKIREDKGPEEADSISRVKEIYKRQFQYKGEAPFS